jgi:hypothetical protein
MTSSDREYRQSLAGTHEGVDVLLIRSGNGGVSRQRTADDVGVSDVGLVSQAETDSDFLGSLFIKWVDLANLEQTRKPISPRSPAPGLG